MKSFEKDLANICDVEISTLVGSYKYEVFGSHTCAIEGHKGLLSYDSDAICFKIAGGKLAVRGENLKICTLERHFAVVKGDILSCGVEK